MPQLRFPAFVDRFDAAVDQAFEPLRNHPVTDRVFYTASELGNNSLIWHLIGTARGLLTEEPPYRGVVRLCTALGIESALVNGAMKSLVQRERPPWEDDRPHTLHKPRTSSFPSGHASAAFTAAGILSDGDKLAPLYYATAVVVASSRIYTRSHHGSDVVAGALLGVAFARLARRLRPLNG